IARRGSVASASRRAGSSGVFPSCSVTTGVASETGRNSRYRSITPGQEFITDPRPRTRSRAPTPRVLSQLTALDADGDGFAGDDGQLVDGRQRVPQDRKS